MFCAASAATVVPHEPAPMTATRIGTVGRLPRRPYTPLVRPAVLVPVKAFAAAKRRLADVLPAPDRAELARRGWPRAVIAAARPPDGLRRVRRRRGGQWAEAAGTQVLWRPGHGLNGAVTDGVASLPKWASTDVVVAHADLPLANDLGRASSSAGLVTLVPDRHDDGTNVIALPAGLGFRFALRPRLVPPPRGRGRRLGLRCGSAGDPRLGLDVDLPADLGRPGVQEVLPWLPTTPASRR